MRDLILIIILLVLPGIALNVFLSKPLDALRNAFWNKSPAPGESIDGAYYPNGKFTIPFIEYRQATLGSLDACRTWAKEQANATGDPDFKRSSYECQLGCRQMRAGISCRAKVQ